MLWKVSSCALLDTMCLSGSDTNIFLKFIAVSLGQKVCGGYTSLLSVATDRVNLSSLLVRLVVGKQLFARS